MTSGIYIMSNPRYGSENIIKIGSSIDIGRGATSGCYTTMFLDKDRPKLLKYYQIDDYKTKAELRSIEYSIHRFFNEHRCQPNRELFRNLDIELIDNYMHNRQFNFSEGTKMPKAEYLPKVGPNPAYLFQGKVHTPEREGL